MSEVATTNNNKRMLLILAAVFIVPVILAKLALENDWFNRAATNKGELLSPVLDFTPLNKTDSKKWRLVYILPQQCDQSCENAIFSINQVRIALGKKMDRLDSVVVWTNSSDEGVVSKLAEQQTINLLMADEQNVNNVFKDVATDGIFLTDTLDNVILRYPLHQEKQQAVLRSRDILADVRKLLKLSRIG